METYQHTETGQVGRRQPVLLYGDSFTHCVITAEECFQGFKTSGPMDCAMKPAQWKTKNRGKLTLVLRARTLWFTAFSC